MDVTIHPFGSKELIKEETPAHLSFKGKTKKIYNHLVLFFQIRTHRERY